MKTLMDELTIAHIWLIVVWGANITDLIRGNWFYHSWESVVFCNVLGIISLIYIIYNRKKH